MEANQRSAVVLDSSPPAALPEDEIKGWEKLMDSPVLPEPSEELSKTRFRLLVASSLSIGIGLWKLSIGTGSTILGLRIENLTDEFVRVGLLAILLYLLTHFVWSATDAFVEWRLRLTGYERAFSLGQPGSSVEREHPKTPRQATLYSWWASEAKRIGDLASTANKVEAAIAEWSKTNSIQEVKISELRQQVSNLSENIRHVGTVARHPQLHASLNRFDRWFQYFAISQNYRWFAFDFALPIAVGIAGVVSLTRAWW